MTDLATIRIPVDSSDMVQAVQQSKNLERAVKLLVDAFDSGAIGADQLSKGLLQVKREYKELFTSSQQATVRVRGFAQSLMDSKEAAEKAAIAKSNLAMVTKKAETAFALANQKAKEELQTLRNRAEFAWAMAMQREKESQMAIRAAEQQAAAELRLNQAQQVSQKGARQSELFIQQLGYQVGDFAVQVQSGTSALVAFAQQGTQILGFLPMAGAFGAVAGAVLAVTTAVAGFVLNMRSASDAAEKNSEKVTTLSEAIGRLDVVQQAMTTSLRGNLIAAFGESSEAVGGLINKLREAEFEAAIRPVRSAIDQITVGIDQVNIAVENFEAFRKMEEQGVVLSGVQQRLLEESRVLIERNLSLALAYDSVREAVDKIGQSKSSEDLVANFAQAIEIAESLGGPIANELVKKLIAAAEEAGILPEAIKQAQSAAEDFNNTNMSDGLKDALSVAQQLALATREALFPQRVGRGDPRQFEDDPYWSDRYMPDPQKFDLTKGVKTRSGGGRREGQLRKEIDLTKELTQAEKERDTLVKSIESSLESSFMSMVEGTESVKDAFKKMAYEIIKELYRVLVVQRMVSGISGGLGFLTGAVTGTPSTGTLGLPKFATGGSMMPNRPYLVGEHGPELVIPRHSGTVVNANQTANAMGGGEGFTQNLTISVTGSDAAMVRAEVAKMIPQITNATKAAVIDAKQRGGQMAAAFR